MITGFLSLLIVIPHLSTNQELYGIYIFCVSFILYLTYADIGFLGAGQKYAAEAFARNNREEEVGIFGFTGFVLLLVILPFSGLMIYFSFNPEEILKGLTTQGVKIASNVFLILAILTPFQIILQRLVQSILIIRIKDFVSLKIDAVFNVIKILAIYVFFTDGKYQIVEYFLFCNIITIIGSLVVLFIIRNTENYNFIALFKAIRFSRKYFELIKKLAFSSFFLTIGFLVYYELDLIIIGKWFGPKEVAIYAIAFTFLNFLRSLWNIVFSPFSQRFNHLVTEGSNRKMKKLTARIIDFTFPLTVIVTVVLFFSIKYIVIYWVGIEYVESIKILQILIISTGFGFITQPAGYYFLANVDYLYIYLLAFVLPVCFILGIYLFVPSFGIAGFALSKTITITIGFIISYLGILKLFNPNQIIIKWVIPISIFLFFSFLFKIQFLPYFFTYSDKSTVQLISVVFFSGTFIFLSYLCLLMTDKAKRILLIRSVKKILF